MAKTEEEKLSGYLTKLQRTPTSTQAELYKFADFIELKCIANLDGIYAQTDFIDDIRPRAEDLYEVLEEDGDDEDDEFIEIKGDKAETNTRWSMRASDCYSLFPNRSIVFGEDYPFEIDATGKILSLKADLTDRHKLYIFLLFSANLQYTGDFQPMLTSTFEYLCLEVLRDFVPERAKMMLFASSNLEDVKDWVVPKKKLWDKLEYLATELRTTVRVSKTEIDDRDSGDGGIDIAAVIPFFDEQSHVPVFIGQCACSPIDWISKQDDIGYNNLNNLFNLKTTPVPFVFIPQSYRLGDGNWFRVKNIRATHLIDRQRILAHFHDIEEFRSYRSHAIVEKLIDQKASAV